MDRETKHTYTIIKVVHLLISKITLQIRDYLEEAFNSSPHLYTGTDIHFHLHV